MSALVQEHEVKMIIEFVRNYYPDYTTKILYCLVYRNT
jgi:hypothetical protein